MFAAVVVLMAGVYIWTERTGGFRWAKGGDGWGRHVVSRLLPSRGLQQRDDASAALPVLGPAETGSASSVTPAVWEGTVALSEQRPVLSAEPVSEAVASEAGAEEGWGTLPPEVTISLEAWAREHDELSVATESFPGSFPVYEEYRLERDRLHARQMEALERAMNDPEVAEAKRWESHQRMLDMLASREREVELEYMLRARGYTDAVVAVREDYANVVVDGLLEEHDAARIGELVVRVAGVPIERIAIVDGYQGP